MSVEIKHITNADLDKIVEIHNSAFPNFFLTSLGPSFLKTYYSSINNSSLGFLLGAYMNNELSGFAAVANVSRGFNRKLILEHKWLYLKLIVQLIFLNPMVIVRLKRNLNKNLLSDDALYAELMSIAVHQSYQGNGIGKKLLIAVQVLLKEKQIESLSLTTDYHNNENALAFYKSLGYAVMYDFETYPNRKMYRLIKQL